MSCPRGLVTEVERPHEHVREHVRRVSLSWRALVAIERTTPRNIARPEVWRGRIALMSRQAGQARSWRSARTNGEGLVGVVVR